MYITSILLFILLFSTFRIFDLGDSLQGFIYWFCAAVLLVVGSGLIYWKLKGVKIAVLVCGLMLISGFISLRYTTWSGYTVDIADTKSNIPTLELGDVVVSKWFNLSLQRGDMVAVKLQERIDRKRLHGLPGDELYICDAKVFINGWYYSAENQWQGAEKTEKERCNSRRSSLTLSADEYFVLGDNLNDSFDSRYYGPVPSSAIIANSIYKLTKREGGKAVQLSLTFNDSVGTK